MRITISFILVVLSSTAFASDCTVTKAQYDALEMGMRYQQAVDALGCEGEELSISEMGSFKTIMMMWEGNSLSASMAAIFQNDRLIQKEEFGLN
ncbi:DUF3862 domain-containing protein [uncultured Nitratireductor sp.]|uniref:DUF3862 domain-containing protein n=1 Tax=uncultured Nitratireductor sp. TaxID=520953 RepID=UPI0025E7256C|nr:DUF3862 domain-containing protein [uncultured Nitratireductor sp.]